jgi:DNA-binding MarR family transcriptional regulator
MGKRPIAEGARKVAGSAALVPEIGQGKRGAEGHLAYLLRQANVALRAHLERALADFGVTQAQFAVLTMVAAYPGLSNADLARLSLLTPQTLSVTVGNLRRDGLVESRPHTVHGRIRTLELTDSGKAALARCRSRVNAIEKALAAELSASEERAVRKWLAAVAVTCSEQVV